MRPLASETSNAKNSNATSQAFVADGPVPKQPPQTTPEQISEKRKWRNIFKQYENHPQMATHDLQPRSKTAEIEHVHSVERGAILSSTLFPPKSGADNFKVLSKQNHVQSRSKLFHPSTEKDAPTVTENKPLPSNPTKSVDPLSHQTEPTSGPCLLFATKAHKTDLISSSIPDSTNTESGKLDLSQAIHIRDVDAHMELARGINPEIDTSKVRNLVLDTSRSSESSNEVDDVEALRRRCASQKAQLQHRKELFSALRQEYIDICRRIEDAQQDHFKLETVLRKTIADDVQRIETLQNEKQFNIRMLDKEKEANKELNQRLQNEQRKLKTLEGALNSCKTNMSNAAANILFQQKPDLKHEIDQKEKNAETRHQSQHNKLQEGPQSDIAVERLKIEDFLPSAIHTAPGSTKSSEKTSPQLQHKKTLLNTYLNNIEEPCDKHALQEDSANHPMDGVLSQAFRKALKSLPPKLAFSIVEGITNVINKTLLPEEVSKRAAEDNLKFPLRRPTLKDALEVPPTTDSKIDSRSFNPRRIRDPSCQREGVSFTINATSEHQCDASDNRRGHVQSAVEDNENISVSSASYIDDNDLYDILQNMDGLSPTTVKALSRTVGAGLRRGSDPYNHGSDAQKTHFLLRTASQVPYVNGGDVRNDWHKNDAPRSLSQDPEETQGGVLPSPVLSSLLKHRLNQLNDDVAAIAHRHEKLERQIEKTKNVDDQDAVLRIELRRDLALMQLCLLDLQRSYLDSLDAIQHRKDLSSKDKQDLIASSLLNSSRFTKRQNSSHEGYKKSQQLANKTSANFTTGPSTTASLNFTNSGAENVGTIKSKTQKTLLKQLTCKPPTSTSRPPPIQDSQLFRSRTSNWMEPTIHSVSSHSSTPTGRRNYQSEMLPYINEQPTKSTLMEKNLPVSTMHQIDPLNPVPKRRIASAYRIPFSNLSETLITSPLNHQSSTMQTNNKSQLRPSRSIQLKLEHTSSPKISQKKNDKSTSKLRSPSLPLQREEQEPCNTASTYVLSRHRNTVKGESDRHTTSSTNKLSVLEQKLNFDKRDFAHGIQTISVDPPTASTTVGTGHTSTATPTSSQQRPVLNSLSIRYTSPQRNSSVITNDPMKHTLQRHCVTSKKINC